MNIKLDHCEECHDSGLLRDDDQVAICPFCNAGDQILKQHCIEICKEIDKE